ncbi:hypothetical protein H257_06572 [Aphanomyces astaci]|uniref:Uncharacterized protein n=1 Tax=Aphanomyces astaci TaxID=112090 RepID=W4GKM6_APHAT|nr:hypothetical protein H257_06572 [Aphanomyces astaci]ETV80222.1 hypothetical protein H257_06572 [Aphanomyces astaci]|eukprot:XP_009830146.1 hypothetical protein H257_06572 [Aphanomyces astaci]
MYIFLGIGQLVGAAFPTPQSAATEYGVRSSGVPTSWIAVLLEARNHGTPEHDNEIDGDVAVIPALTDHAILDNFQVFPFAEHDSTPTTISRGQLTCRLSYDDDKRQEMMSNVNVRETPREHQPI